MRINFLLILSSIGLTIIVLCAFLVAWMRHDFFVEDYCQAKAIEIVKDNNCDPVPAPVGWNASSVCKRFSEQLKCEAENKFLGIF